MTTVVVPSLFVRGSPIYAFGDPTSQSKEDVSSWTGRVLERDSPGRPLIVWLRRGGRGRNRTHRSILTWLSLPFLHISPYTFEGVPGGFYTFISSSRPLRLRVQDHYLPGYIPHVTSTLWTTREVFLPLRGEYSTRMSGPVVLRCGRNPKTEVSLFHVLWWELDPLVVPVPLFLVGTLKYRYGDLLCLFGYRLRFEEHRTFREVLGQERGERSEWGVVGI